MLKISLGIVAQGKGVGRVLKEKPLVAQSLVDWVESRADSLKLLLINTTSYIDGLEERCYLEFWNLLALPGMTACYKSFQ